MCIVPVKVVDALRLHVRDLCSILQGMLDTHGQKWDDQWRLHIQKQIDKGLYLLDQYDDEEVAELDRMAEWNETEKRNLKSN